MGYIFDYRNTSITNREISMAFRAKRPKGAAPIDIDDMKKTINENMFAMFGESREFDIKIIELGNDQVEVSIIPLESSSGEE